MGISNQYVEIVSQRRAKEIKEDFRHSDYFKTRSPKLHASARTYSAAMKQLHRKIQHIGRFGNYSHASIDSGVAIHQGALVYVYPSVTFYRTSSEPFLV